MNHGSVASKEKYAPLLKASALKEESQPAHFKLTHLLRQFLFSDGY